MYLRRMSVVKREMVQSLDTIFTCRLLFDSEDHEMVVETLPY